MLILEYNEKVQKYGYLESKWLNIKGETGYER
jgi:hypothetical protein